MSITGGSVTHIGTPKKKSTAWPRMRILIKSQWQSPEHPWNAIPHNLSSQKLWVNSLEALGEISWRHTRKIIKKTFTKLINIISNIPSWMIWMNKNLIELDKHNFSISLTIRQISTMNLAPSAPWWPEVTRPVTSYRRKVDSSVVRCTWGNTL